MAAVSYHAAGFGLSVQPHRPRLGGREVLIELFGGNVRYSADRLTLPGVTRRFKGFAAAAEENGLSRLYAGFHFRHAVKHGRRQGQSVGRAVAGALRPVETHR